MCFGKQDCTQLGPDSDAKGRDLAGSYGRSLVEKSLWQLSGEGKKGARWNHHCLAWPRWSILGGGSRKRSETVARLGN